MFRRRAAASRPAREPARSQKGETGDLPDAPRARERQQPSVSTVMRDGIEHGVLLVTDFEASGSRGPTTKQIAATKPQTHIVSNQVAGNAPRSRCNNTPIAAARAHSLL